MIEFQLNHAGIEALLSSPEAAAELEHMAEGVAAEAKRTAPVVSGGYRDSIETGSYHDEVSRRATAYVRAGVDYAAEVEVRHRTLGKALGAAGGSA